MSAIHFKMAAREWLFDEKLNSMGLEYKGAWGNLLALAKICNCNGKFLDEVDDPYNELQICKKARISLIHFQKFIVADMLIKRSSDNGIVISIKNWLKYQPEHDRTKVYRNSYKDLKKKETEEVHEENRIEGRDATPKSPFKGVANLQPKSKYSHKVLKMNQDQTKT